MWLINKKQKTSEPPQKPSALSKFKLCFEDTNKKLHLSPTFGKKEPLIVRVWQTSHHAVINFVYDVYLATKTIIKEIM